MFSLNDYLWTAVSKSLRTTHKPTRLMQDKPDITHQPTVDPLDPECRGGCKHTRRPCSHCPGNTYCGGSFLKPCPCYAMSQVCGGIYTKP